ncbi:MAG: ParB/RepB/Spo0J family partition protein [Deltaproteobacteria bacterium]|nr:ParB/RepB/Spo0J family partition protein [Deltaproteobacteria bacterium]
MTNHKKALGKGLGSLIPMDNKQDINTSSNRVYFECHVDDIVPNISQPRKLFQKEQLNELAASIEEKGILQPLVVRSIGGGKYEVVAGERRYRASIQAGLTTVPVVVKETDDTGALEMALIENIQRENLNPIEESLAYKELLSKHQYTQDELATKLGKDRSSIANSLRLLKLPDKIRDHLINSKISMGHARALLAIESKELQIQIADDIIKSCLSVREVEILTKKIREQEVDSPPEKPDTENHANAPARDYTSLIKSLESKLRKKISIKDKGEKGQISITFNNQDELLELVNKLML